VTEAVQERVSMAEWSVDEKDNLIRSYGCDLLVENATPEQIKDTSLPNDAYQVKNKVNDQVQIDLCRGKRVDIFDLYYDKFGKGALINIDWAYGRTNPKLWGYKKPDKKKKR